MRGPKAQIGLASAAVEDSGDARGKSMSGGRENIFQLLGLLLQDHHASLDEVCDPLLYLQALCHVVGQVFDVVPLPQHPRNPCSDRLKEAYKLCQRKLVQHLRFSRVCLLPGVIRRDLSARPVGER
ncbi:hypothetical protein CYMTET_7195 [Cymbomonas tetramitiformis]|uniref:Uncharacterized protein n=1 Tax=Cymbomonas tetramitiformis TaxID=36881 RepID=A0AAE0LH51_9CHLO|nr:hypothetical protein CYMTET_7195 [Cymbomonas tetramitiformis]